MAFLGKILAEGQLPSSKGTLYTVPTGGVAYVKWCSGHNNTVTDDEEVMFYVKKAGSTSRVVGQATLDRGQSCRALSPGETWELSAGDAIEGQTTTATTIDYLITGVEEI